jgi:hypothetical protein
VLERFRDWLAEQALLVPPKSPIGQPIVCARPSWAASNRYLEAGHLSLDNSPAERSLRPVTLGRTNWLFRGGDGGGRTATILFSLTTARRGLGVDPFAYLRDMLVRVATHPARRITELLPDRWVVDRTGSAARPVPSR